MSQLLPGKGSSSFKAWLAWIAFLAAVAACIAGAIAYYFRSSGTDEVASPGPPPITVSVPASRVDEDPSVAFRSFAMVGQKFEPEWLIRVKRVYWAESGALWAEATMPNSANERVFTIEKICQKLTEYAQGTGREWHGVSVRALGGAELHTKTDPAGSCRPAA